MRKTPIRHPVRSHSRDGNPVQGYLRGQGINPPQKRRRVVVGEAFTIFSIVITYPSHARELVEEFRVEASGFLEALTKALEQRAGTSGPWKIRVRGRK